MLREARALARIGHPNVVAIHHIVDSPEVAHPWIVMELVRGQSLADHLAGGPMPPTQAAYLGRGILAALRAAYQVGVLHRDIKPANVLLREDGSPVLTDFGIAAINGMQGLTSTGSVVGSLDYVAPERLNGQEGKRPLICGRSVCCCTSRWKGFTRCGGTRPLPRWRRSSPVRCHRRSRPGR